MAQRNPQTMAKRAREQALRERRERKQAKKAAAAEAKRLGLTPEWMESTDEAPEDGDALVDDAEAAAEIEPVADSSEEPVSGAESTADEPADPEPSPTTR